MHLVPLQTVNCSSRTSEQSMSETWISFFVPRYLCTGMAAPSLASNPRSRTCLFYLAVLQTGVVSWQPTFVVYRRSIHKFSTAEGYDRRGEGIWTALHLLGRVSASTGPVCGAHVSASPRVSSWGYPRKSSCSRTCSPREPCWTRGPCWGSRASCSWRNQLVSHRSPSRRRHGDQEDLDHWSFRTRCVAGHLAPTLLESNTGASPSTPFSSWTSLEKAEGHRSAAHESRKCSHSDPSPANRRYRHSRATNPG